MWQVSAVGQCTVSNRQLRADGGSCPSCASVAEPENEIVSPTRQVRSGVGVLMVGTGAELPAVIVTVAMSSAPRGSETRTETVRAPTVVYV